MSCGGVYGIFAARREIPSRPFVDRYDAAGKNKMEKPKT